MAISEKYVTSAGSGTQTGLSLANSWSWATMLTTAAAGDRCNINGAIAAGSSAVTMTNSGTATSPIILRGYASAIGDGYLGRTNDNGALILTNMPTVTYTGINGRLTTGAFVIVESLQFVSAASFGGLITGADTVITRCYATNSSTNAGAQCIAINGARSMAFNCDATLTSASGGSCCIQVAGTGSVCDSCRCQIPTTSGANCIQATSTSVVHGNTVFSSASTAIYVYQTTGAPFIRDNTIVGCEDGIYCIAAVSVLQRMIGNMITDSTTNEAIHFDSAPAFIAHNRTRDNPGGAYTGNGDWVTATSYNEVTTDTGGSETDYTNFAGNDYNVIFASPATNANSPKFAAIGALQPERTEPAAGGGGGFFVQ